MKQLTINVTDDQYDMIMRASRKRKKSIKSLVLRFFFELDYVDGKKGERK